MGQNQAICPTGGHWLQQIFSLLSITQTRIKITSWNFQHLFITCLCKFDKKNLAVAQSACQLRPISAKILEVSSNSICWDIWKRTRFKKIHDRELWPNSTILQVIACQQSLQVIARQQSLQVIASQQSLHVFASHCKSTFFCMSLHVIARHCT